MNNYFWAYESSSLSNEIYLFNTIEEAREHAIKNGEFDELSCKEAFMAHEENLFFEISEDEINYASYSKINQLSHKVKED